MAKLARLPANDAAPITATRSVRRKRRPRHRYFAFLSYSHADQELAEWLHRELEDFRVPASLAGKLTDNGVVPRRLTPIFRDQHELAAADDLSEEIEAALASTQFLIVLCSPNAAKSRWTNAEIETFKRTRPDGCVLAAIASGEPFASDIRGRAADECFPPALRQKYDRRGRPTGRRAEPLAADLRDQGDGRRMGFLKLVAGMLGVGLDDLVQRETTRRQRRLAWLAAASLAGMGLTSMLALTAIQARDSARDQRREAEGLVAFMVGDLKDKLEPIGRLDALDGVGERVLDYYRKQGTADLPDDALVQRARALSLTAQVAYLRGDLDSARRLYREAAQGTGEAVSRNPGDPQRLFDHAQNIYYFGDIAMQRGDYSGAAQSFRTYKALADKMVSIGPDNLKWRMEVQYADANLGAVLMKQRQFAEASTQFSGALRTIEAIAAIDPNNRDYQRSVAESLAWLADSNLAQGKIVEAIGERERQVGLLAGLAAADGGNVGIQEMLIPAHLKLGVLYAAHGDSARASAELGEAVTAVERLIPQEPTNRKWREYEAVARLTLAMHSLDAGNSTTAAGETDKGCAVVGDLIARDPAMVDWQRDQRACLALRARIALARGSVAEALGSAKRSVALSEHVKTGDALADRYAAAQSWRLLGDIYRSGGQMGQARNAWRTGLSKIPSDPHARPSELAERAQLLDRLGERAESTRIFAGLRSMGVRSAEILSV